MSSLDFTLLLSPDNASRKAAEATFDAARQSHPQLVAAQLITTLNTSGDPATQELCAVLARRYLPAMFALTPLVFTEETRESVKTGLLSALSAGYAPSLRRKLCSMPPMRPMLLFELQMNEKQQKINLKMNSMMNLSMYPNINLKHFPTGTTQSLYFNILIF